MITAILWLDPAEGTLQYFVVNEDVTRFNGVMVNVTGDIELETELTQWMHGTDGNQSREPCKLEHLRHSVESGAALIQCGFCS